MVAFVQFAQGVVYLAVAAVGDVWLEEIVQYDGAVGVAVHHGGDVMSQAASGRIDAYRVFKSCIQCRSLVGHAAVAEVGVADEQLYGWVHLGDDHVIVEAAEHDVAVLACGVGVGGAGIVR